MMSIKNKEVFYEKNIHYGIALPNDSPNVGMMTVTATTSSSHVAVVPMSNEANCEYVK